MTFRCTGQILKASSKNIKKKLQKLKRNAGCDDLCEFDPSDDRGKDAGRARPSKINEYNQEIQKMCEEEGYQYIDSTFIVTKNPGLFEQDGIHMKKSIIHSGFLTL